MRTVSVVGGGGEAWEDVYARQTGAGTWGLAALPSAKAAIRRMQELGSRVVLDCGCGDGRNLTDLMATFGLVVGTDISTSALALAREAVPGAVLAIDDIMESKFTDRSFDSVVCFEVLSHLTQPQRAIAELLRLCKPGGLAVVDVFAPDDATRLDAMTSLGNDEYLYSQAFFFRYYSEKAARDLAEASGANVVGIENVSWIDPPHGTYRPYVHRHETWCITLQRR